MHCLVLKSNFSRNTYFSICQKHSKIGLYSVIHVLNFWCLALVIQHNYIPTVSALLKGNGWIWIRSLYNLDGWKVDKLCHTFSVLARALGSKFSRSFYLRWTLCIMNEFSKSIQCLRQTTNLSFFYSILWFLLHDFSNSVYTLLQPRSYGNLAHYRAFVMCITVWYFESAEVLISHSKRKLKS